MARGSGERGEGSVVEREESEDRHTAGKRHGIIVDGVTVHGAKGGAWHGHGHGQV